MMDIKQIIEELKSFDWASMSAENMGTWPVAVKSLVSAVLFSVILGAVFFFLVKEQNEQYQIKLAAEQSKMQKLNDKAQKAASLELLKEQLDIVKNKMTDLLKALPKDADIPDLIDDIERVSMDHGLDYEDIKFLSEQQREDFKESPVEIKLKGSYHEVGSFVSSVAALPSIVTLHDFTMKSDNEGILGVTIVAKTYSYRDGDDNE